MKDLLDTIVKGHMDIYKTAFEEGRKFGIVEGRRLAWEEIKKDIDKLVLTIKKGE